MYCWCVALARLKMGDCVISRPRTSASDDGVSAVRRPTFKSRVGSAVGLPPHVPVEAKCLDKGRRKWTQGATVPDRMNDEWRLQVDSKSSYHAGALASRLAADELKHDLSRKFHDRIIVSVDGARVFVYSGTRDQAEKARVAIEADARSRGREVAIDLRRWHPTAEEWQDPDLPVPSGGHSLHTEREQLMSREREQTENRGYPEFEVRAQLASHRDAMSLVSRLCGEGLPVVHRWKYLLVGATDEDSANEMADHIRAEAPNGAAVSVEGTWAAVRGVSRPSPFSVWGSSSRSHKAGPPENEA
jgi:hypothetical protein